MPIVNEFTDGGVYEHFDCAPACVQSRLIQGGIVTTIDEIEELAGTKPPRGTLFPGIESCLRHYGVVEVFSAGEPPPGWIMNPAGGRIVAPSSFPAYLAAAQGGCIVMADPAAPPPPPPPTPLEGPDVQTFVIEPMPPGSPPTLVPGVTGSTTLVLGSFSGGSVTLFLWTEAGDAVASRVVSLLGNDPNVRGPVEVSGYLAQIFAAPPATPGPAAPAKAGVPYLLGLYPAASTYSASLF